MARRARSIEEFVNKKVFLSWGGDDALKIARWLKEKVFDSLPGYNAFLSEEIEPGEEFQNRIHGELKSAHHAIGIMTDVAIDRPWFLYELAFLKGRLSEVPLIRFGSVLPEGHPLKIVHYADGSDFTSLRRMIESLLKNSEPKTRDLCLRDMDSKAADWAKLVSPIGAKHQKTESLQGATAAAIRAILDYKVRGNAEMHPCMQAVASKTLEDVAVAFHGLVDQKQRTYKIDYRRYPEYLIYLQKPPLEVVTNAIAVVNDIEEFWAHKTGDAILETTNKDSARVFIFENPGSFSMHFQPVFRHAEKYRVYVMSAKEFGRVGHRVTRDFSVMIDIRSGDRMVAYYDNTADTIQFTTDRETINQKMSVFHEVLDWAHLVSPRPRGEWDEQQKELGSLMFSDPAQETGQHSNVIPIERYDAFEEDHPFYREMHVAMLAEFRKRVTDADTDMKVLEVGAGTGLFTKRLAQQPYPGLSIRAMEPDAKAHPLLLRKLQRKPNIVRPVMASILNYDTQEQFRFVFSSFSEHHIRPEDKEKYFEILMRSMTPGAFLIIGDEFLAPMKSGDDEEYERALERYHNYIIERASEAHHFEVVELERMALESGRPKSKGRVDFKVSLDWYKQKAGAAGFELQAEQCISPKEMADEVGGIYVLVYRRP